MKKILGMLLYGGIMFGVTAGLGMFMMKKTTTHAPTAEDGEVEEALDEFGNPIEEGHGDTGVAAHEGSGEHQTAELHGSEGHAENQSDSHAEPEHDEQLPVAVRSTPMTVEEIVRMGLSLKARDEAIRKREESIREIEAQQRLVLSDLASAQTEVENLLAQTSEQRAAKEELLARIAAQSASLQRERASFSGDAEKLSQDLANLELAKKELEAEKQKLVASENDLTIKRKALEDDRAAFDQTTKQVTEDSRKLARDREAWLKDKESVDSDKRQIAQDRTRLEAERMLLEQDKRAFVSTTGNKSPGTSSDTKSGEVNQDPKEVVKVLSDMPPESAAANLRQMDLDGNTDFVVEILRAMETRKASAIIDSMQDEALATKFLMKMSVKNETSKAAKKP